MKRKRRVVRRPLTKLIKDAESLLKIIHKERDKEWSGNLEEAMDMMGDVVTSLEAAEEEEDEEDTDESWC
jgi:hypothetical protein